MLIELRVENHRSVREEQVLTMEAGRGGDPDDPRPRRVAGHGTALLPAAGLYGANASGKSNLLSAMAFMCDAVIHSHRSWPPDGGVPREPFAWGPKRKEPSLFEVTILIAGVRYRYGFVASDDCFVEEWLFVWPRGRKQVWLEREEGSLKFGDHLRGENRLVEQVTRPNALFLSAAAQHGHEQLAPLFHWFSAVRTVNVSRWPRGLAHWLNVFGEQEIAGPRKWLRGQDAASRRRLQSFIELLRAADVGIMDVKLTEPENEVEGETLPWNQIGGGSQLLLQHRCDGGDGWLALEEESHGTRTLFKVAPLLLSVLHGGGVLVVDELEASLHPLLALEILKQFNRPESNSHGAQLIFTTHDTNLLGTTITEPPLRRDQVWLTEKDQGGATCLYPLTDYKPRKAENLERGYLQGRYGAIPFLGDLIRWEE